MGHLAFKSFQLSEAQSEAAHCACFQSQVYPQSNQTERHMMNQVKLTIPEIGLIAGTRAAAGAGLALLLCNRLNPEQRRAVGWTLLAVGIATTIPLVAHLLGKPPAPADPEDM